MYLQANPSKGKSEQEKDEMKTHYTPGEDVLPAVVFAPRSDDDSDDERLLAHVRELSVADIDPAVEANRRSQRTVGSASRERRVRPGYSPRDREIRRLEHVENAQRQHHAADRNVSHQSSLRSLLSADSTDSTEIQQEILASILSSGMLDGLDIDNLTAEQEEELTERIAEAYRHRHHDLYSARRTNNQSSHTDLPGDRTSNSQEGQQIAAAAHRPHRAAVAGQHLIEQWMQDSSRITGRTSSHLDARSGNSSITSPVAAHTGTNIITPPRTIAGSAATRTTTTTTTTNDRTRTVQQAGSSPRSSPNTSAHHPQRHSPDSRGDMRGQMANTEQSPGTIPGREPAIIPSDTLFRSPALGHRPLTQRHTTEDRSAVDLATSTPSVICRRCDRADIQHDVHYHCDKCYGGSFDLCLRCYRNGAGCDNWWGFGYSAQARYENNAPAGGWPSTYDLPHLLIARRFPPQPSSEDLTQHNSGIRRPLQEGAFCERCHSFANDRYWHCARCMEGAWGFCNECVRKGKHCTHPLLPTASSSTSEPGSLMVYLPNMRPSSMAIHPLEVRCAVCRNIVPKQLQHLHCDLCNNGDYDMCTDCHRSLVATGKIATPPDQRRCLQGHSMALVQYLSNAPNIEQRVVLAQPLGPTSQVRSTTAYIALWSWFPAADVDDELTFPKHAEIRDVERLNEDYSLGTYAGDVGLFPSNHAWPLQVA